MRTSSNLRRTATGFTLLEVIFAIVLLGILVRFAMMKLVTPGTMTLPAQAQSVAGLVRKAQALAVQRGQRMCFRVATSGVNGGFAFAPPTSGACTATEASLSVAQGVSVGSAATIYFNSLGLPVDNAGAPLANSATFTVSYTTGSATDTKSIVVSALTGRVSVQ